MPPSPSAQSPNPENPGAPAPNNGTLGALDRVFRSVHWRVGERLALSALALLAGLVGYTTNDALSEIKRLGASLNTIDTRVAVIEASRFTANDGMKLTEQILILAGRLPDSFPPPIWLNQVYEPQKAQVQKAIDKIEENQAKTHQLLADLARFDREVLANQKIMRDRLGAGQQEAQP